MQRKLILLLISIAAFFNVSAQSILQPEDFYDGSFTGFAWGNNGGTWPGPDFTSLTGQVFAFGGTSYLMSSGALRLGNDMAGNLYYCVNIDSSGFSVVPGLNNTFGGIFNFNVPTNTAGTITANLPFTTGSNVMSGNASGLTNLQGSAVTGNLTNQINTSNAIGPRVLTCGRSTLVSGVATVNTVYADTSTNTSILTQEYAFGALAGNHTVNITNISQGVSFSVVSSSVPTDTNEFFWSVITNK